MLTSTATVTFVPGGNLDGRRHNGLDFDEDEVMQVGTPINGLEAALEAAATPLPAGLVTYCLFLLAFCKSLICLIEGTGEIEDIVHFCSFQQLPPLGLRPSEGLLS